MMYIVTLENYEERHSHPNLQLDIMFINCGKKIFVHRFRNFWYPDTFKDPKIPKPHNLT